MRLKILVALGVVVLAVGCASDSAPTPTAKELALQHWNATRSAVLLSLAKDQYTSGSFDKCKETLDEALRTDPTNPEVHIFLSKVAIEQGQLDSAQGELDIVRNLEKDPAIKAQAPTTQPGEHSDPPVVAQADYLSGVIYQRWEQPKKALEFYTKAGDLAPDELSYLMAKAETLVTLGRQSEALDILQSKVVYFEHSPVIRDGVGMLLLQAHRTGEAVDMFREASILTPDDLSIREHLGLALYQAKQYVEAADVLQRLVNEDTRAKRADLWMALAECQMDLNRAGSARISAQKACDLDDSSSYAWITLGKVSMQLKDLRRADYCLDRATSLDPESSEAQLMTGYLRLRQNRLQDAMDSFAQASQLDPDDTTSLCMMGYVMEKLGRTKEAEEYCAEALKIDPKDPLAGRLMADVEGR